MIDNDKRKHDRIDSVHLLNYVYFDVNGKETMQGMGRTLNVSKSGLLLETHTELELHHKVSLGIGIEDEMVDIRGKIVFTKTTDNDMYESGIHFLEPPPAALEVLKKFIDAFNAR
ncbi:MAG: PilZ domain-containing protein [Desulfobacteraceae bacterium]|nr:PilZ domain-containing protein [Desulfobacteraceae bacterium]